MKFEIKSRWTGAVIFTADIDCDDGASHGIQLGLAVKVAVKAGADLTSAYMAGADLTRANLASANLASAYMAGANLTRAYMAGAYMAGADLTRADLTRANLADANLASADLTRADLNGISGLNDWIKCIQIEDWPIAYTDEDMQIGCQRHPIALWETFSDAEIRAMDGRKALAFWSKWKAWIFQAIEMAPAKPTAPVESEVAQ